MEGPSIAAPEKESHARTETDDPQADDAVAAPERPNLPGTVAEWPNWSLALERPLEEIETLELPGQIAAALKR